MILIFAYGSNLDVEQMERRCPSARVRAEGRIANHRLAFAGYSHGWRGAVATLIHMPRRLTRGIVYAISKEDLLRLDGFEGAPHAYVRRVYPIRLGTGEKVMAGVYIQPSPVEESSPSARYFETVARAYRAWGFCRRAVDQALLSACKADAAAEARKIREQADADRRALIARRATAWGEERPASVTLWEPPAKRAPAQQSLLDATPTVIPMSGRSFFKHEKPRKKSV